jgi:hypothetical protein
MTNRTLLETSSAIALAVYEGTRRNRVDARFQSELLELLAANLDSGE